MAEMREELEAMKTISEALERIEDEGARSRVLRWAVDAYAVRATTRVVGAGVTGGEYYVPSLGGATVQGLTGGLSDSPSTTTYASAGELVEAAGPDSTVDRVLVVGYWLQAIKGEQDFTSQSVNDELKNMGHGVGNITDALSRLINRRPSLVRQTRKSGSSRQARKRYALTDAGRRRVEVLLAGGNRGEEEE